MLYYFKHTSYLSLGKRFMQGEAFFRSKVSILFEAGCMAESAQYAKEMENIFSLRCPGIICPGDLGK
jgi:hypothetical protein